VCKYRENSVSHCDDDGDADDFIAIDAALLNFVSIVHYFHYW
jgi:hypothetical protein